MSGIAGVQEQRAAWREATRRYQERHPDRVREHRKKSDAKRWLTGSKWSQKHPEKQRENERAWRDRNPEKMHESYRRFYLKNKDRLREKDRRQRDANPERIIANLARRRALRSSAEGDFTAQEFKDLCAEYKNACAYCGETDVKLTADHDIPLARGGSNWISNILPSCKSCNSRKRTRTAQEFLFLLVEGSCRA